MHQYDAILRKVSVFIIVMCRTFFWKYHARIEHVLMIITPTHFISQKNITYNRIFSFNVDKEKSLNCILLQFTDSVKIIDEYKFIKKH